MVQSLDRDFGERFLRSIEDFYGYGVHLLFNDWWEAAPAEVIDKYVASLEANPEIAALAREQYYAEPLDLDSLKDFAPGTLGHAYRDFMVSNDLMERLAEGYRDLHEQFSTAGKLDRMPAILKYKVLRGYQTHDLHHVLTGYPATPLGELGLQGRLDAHRQGDDRGGAALAGPPHPDLDDVVIVDALPRTASQKIMRRVMRDRYQLSHPAIDPSSPQTVSPSETLTPRP